MLESERKARRDAEAEKEQFESKLDSLRTLLLNDNTMKDETRKQLQVLSSLARKRKSTNYYEEEPCDNINSTGSILSDLSLTQSGDDLLDPKPCAQQVKWKKHRPSLNNSGILNLSGARKSRQSAEKRRSARRSVIEVGPNDKIVTQTKFTIPVNKRQAICAESFIEAISNPTPTSTSSDEVVMVSKTPSRKKNAAPEPPKTPHLYPNIVKAFETPSAPSIDELDRIDYHYNNFETVKKAPAVEQTPSKAINTRSHTFSSKTFLKPETCGECRKKIKFGSAGFRCTECRTCVHQDCKDRFQSRGNCFPQKSTPIAKSGNVLGNISDYTPSIAPMIPALIVHCVNEIEMRGLKEVGLYRISGSDRDVKALKEKFLKNNGIPNIADTDVHVLCGCVKDFLRSLKERLIPMRLWSEFSNASQTTPMDDDYTGSKAMIRVVEMLPQPNRDTLAYIIMHFQRISECPEVKMPLTNFAKIFGPTIVGYSTADPDTHAMFAETQIQFSVMFALLNIPTVYWNKFIALDVLTREEQQKEIDTYGSKFYSGTPSMKIIRKDKKFYDTPPYSAISKKRK